MKKALLITHLYPEIHGQAMMGNLLLRVSKNWDEPKLIPFNAVYDEDRYRLGSFSFQKLVRLWNYLFEILDIVKKENPDICIITFAFFPNSFIKDFIFLIFMRWVLNRRVIAWIHMDPHRFDYDRRSILFKIMASMSLRSIDKWVACGANLSHTWPVWMKGKPIEEISNSIHDPIDSINSLASPGANNDVTTLFMSSIEKEKGWLELLKAAIMVCSRHPTARFHFYGAIGINQGWDEVIKAFANSGHPDRIVYFGPVSGNLKHRAFQEADIVCLPSYTEAFPLVILEALSFGLPCIATDVGAVKEAVIEGQNGWLVAPKDVNSLFETLSTALSDRNRLKKMGQNARSIFVENYSESVFGNKWKNLLSSESK